MIGPQLAALQATDVKIYLDCIPCFYRQAIEAARRSGLSEKRIKTLIDRIAGLLSEKMSGMTPPEAAYEINRMIVKGCGNKDIYAEEKSKSNALALKSYRRCMKTIHNAEDRLLCAVEMAIAGNIIDYGAKHRIDLDREIDNIVKREQRFVRNSKADYFAYNEFRDILGRAGSLVYLADNAGESVFDRMLIETLNSLYPGMDITYAVKDKPILNDATMEDALICRIDKSAGVISSGSVIPGTVLDKTSAAFRKILDRADLVISKGQGNFESFIAPDKNVFYLFMAKCPMVAREAGCDVGSINLYFKKASTLKRTGRKG